MRVSDLNIMNESDELLAKMSDELKKEYQTPFYPDKLVI